MDSIRRAGAVAGVVVIASSSLGCWAVHNRQSDMDRTPVVNTGAGASIIYPGQTSPRHPGNLHPREAGYGQGVMTSPGAPGHSGAPAPAPGSPQATSPTHPAPGTPPNVVAPGVAVPPPEYASRRASGSGGASGGGVALLGGAETEETRHVKVREEPRFMKYLALPFAVIAAPFKYGAEKIRGEPEAGPEIPRLATQPRPVQNAAPPVLDYETNRLQGLERELAERAGSPTAPGSARSHAGSPTAPGGARSHAGSDIAGELAALRQRARAAQPAPSPAPPAHRPAPGHATPFPAPGHATPTPTPGPDASSGRVDRDGDGRTDHWIERKNGVVSRERYDENLDGRPDRTLVYDPAGHEVVLIEEDADFDGRSDSWTAFRAGRVTGRRVDGNGDGHVDSWSSYRDGRISRLERDADGDGFRDHVAHYRDGRLAREERDEDADGRTDLVRYFDDAERVERVEEDADGDGEMDVVSYYEGGRLLRREVLDATVLGLGPSEGTEQP